MAHEFKIIVITPPDTPEEELGNEIKKTVKLLESGVVDYLHLRKPNWSDSQLRQHLKKIPSHLHHFIKIHSHFYLTNEFDLAGVHLNHRCPEAPGEIKNVSRSCHSLLEITLCGKMQYVTISPVFDSISKEGYKSKYNLEEIADFAKEKKVVALGGVQPHLFPTLKKFGFCGAAMLGFVWNNDTDFVIEEIKKHKALAESQL